MGMLGRAFGAGGAAVAGLANKYIDDEIQQQRAAYLAELQRTNADAMNRDRAKLDDERAPVVRQRAADDAKAAATTADEIEAKRLDPNNPLVDLKKKAGDREAAATTERNIASQTAMLSNPALNEAARKKAAEDELAKTNSLMAITQLQAANPDFLKAKEKIELSDPKIKAQIQASQASAAASYASAANSKAHADQTKFQTETLRRADGILADMLKTVDDKTLTPQERAERLGSLQTKLQVLGGKGKSDETDTVKVTEKKIGADGTETTTERTEKRRAGQGGGGNDAASPYPDGAELRGKDGKTYVVRNGVPTLKEPEAAAPKRSLMQAGPPVDRIGDDKIGPLTPMSRIEEAAKAGNKRAQEYLARREQARLDDISASAGAMP